jgi:beta-lactamase regulating signal transducer with metallopeptidase domain
MEAHMQKVRRRNRIVFAGCMIFVSVVYAGTMIRMKQTAPGNLADMVGTSG